MKITKSRYKAQVMVLCAKLSCVPEHSSGVESQKEEHISDMLEGYRITIEVWELYRNTSRDSLGILPDVCR